MEHFPSTLTREESDLLVERIGVRYAETGLYLWAVEVPGSQPFIGFVGLSAPTFDTAFTPCVEVGWRLARTAWGQGYATEAARTVVADGFGRLGLDGDRVVHADDEPSVPAGDAAARHDAGPGGRLRPPEPAARASAATPRPVPAGKAVGRRTPGAPPDARRKRG